MKSLLLLEKLGFEGKMLKRQGAENVPVSSASKRQEAGVFRGSLMTEPTMVLTHPRVLRLG